MALSTNGALGWINALDGAVMAASSEASGLPIGNVQWPSPLVTKWRSAGALSCFWTADFGAVQPIDVVGMFVENFTAAATWRIRLSSSSAHAGGSL
jgi:hypothetical protein